MAWVEVFSPRIVVAPTPSADKRKYLSESGFLLWPWLKLVDRRGWIGTGGSSSGLGFPPCSAYSWDGGCTALTGAHPRQKRPPAERRNDPNAGSDDSQQLTVGPLRGCF
jgi:hypothetical protein